MALTDLRCTIYLYREGRQDVFYYSSKDHLDELLNALVDQDEYNLASVIQERYEDITKHMKITEELYTEKKGTLCYVHQIPLFFH